MSTKSALWALTAIATVLAVYTLVPAAHSQPRAPEVNWEYKVTNYEAVGKLVAPDETDGWKLGHLANQEAGLNKLAQDGWELVAVAAQPRTPGPDYYLRRAKK
jgi:hypothetical protein